MSESPGEQAASRLSYSRMPRRWRRVRPQLLIGLGLAATIAVGGWMSWRYVTGISTVRVLNPRVKCASNLRQIGQAVLLYPNEFGGRYPDRLGDLLITEDIGSEAFVCPTTADTPATGPTTQAVASNLSTPGHCSYVYLGKGLAQQTVTADMVIAYEPLSNHGGTGMHVLFGDGHVEFLNAGPQTASLLRQVAAGTWPVRIEWNGSATAAPVPTTQIAPAR